MRRAALVCATTLICADSALAAAQASEAAAKAGAEAGNKSPRVGKFAGNIYSGEYFSKSVYYDNINAFWTGYNMQSYLYAQDCLTQSTLFLDQFHNWQLTAVRYKSMFQLSDLFFTVAGQSANESWYNCYLFYYDISTAYTKKFEKFNDFGDIYLSFIFNMLQNSLSIKGQTENMIKSYAKHDTVAFTRSLGSILRSILDFNMYKTTAASLQESVTTQAFLGQSMLPETPKWERQAALQEKIAYSRAKVDALVAESSLGWED